MSPCAKPLHVLILAGGASAFAQPGDLAYDPAHIVGAGECGRCHSVELLAWQKSQHFRTYRDLPSSKAAESIADRLGIFDITEEADCLQCHFTLRKQEPARPPKAVSGISCELCHGPAKNWINVHNDLGAHKNRPEAEPHEHRAARLAKAHEHGMRPLTNLYDFAASCFRCHTVPNERLVNVGGHTAGSAFEIVSWSQGEVRHNFLDSEVRNRAPDREHLQLMYVVGRMLDLEFGLRGLAKATEDGPYAKAMVLRVQRARNHLVDLIRSDERLGKERVDSKALKRLVDSVPLEFMHSNAAEYEALADRVQATAREFAAAVRHNPADLVQFDRLVPLSNKYHGKAFRE